MYTFDIHSNIGILKVKPLRSVYNFHSNILLHDLIIYPDAGAVERYEAEKDIQMMVFLFYMQIKTKSINWTN